MKQLKRLVGLFLIVCLLPACSSSEEKQSRSFFLMDTVITVTLYTSQDAAEPIFSRCRELLEELDALWSRTVQESDTVRFNSASVGEKISVDARTVQLLRTALLVSEATDGAFDVRVAPLISLWQSCEETQTLPTDDQLSQALSEVHNGCFSLSEDAVVKDCATTKLDLGGIGKGGAISYLMSYLETCNLTGAMISFGSNVAVIGTKSDGSDFRIALRDPTNEDRYAAILCLLPGEILSVSGDYERFYTVGEQTYHHILNPETGYPSDSGLTSVAVICNDGATADALSTALLVMGAERALELYHSDVFDFEAVLISSDGTVTLTDGLSETP